MTAILVLVKEKFKGKNFLSVEMLFKASPFQSQSGPTGFSELQTFSEATKIVKTYRRCCDFHK